MFVQRNGVTWNSRLLFKLNGQNFWWLLKMHLVYNIPYPYICWSHYKRHICMFALKCCVILFSLILIIWLSGYQKHICIKRWRDSIFMTTCASLLMDVYFISTINERGARGGAVGRHFKGIPPNTLYLSILVCPHESLSF